MFISKTLSFYKRKDIQAELIRVAEDREIAIKYGERGFGRRPDTIKYESDVMEFAKKGATSLHCSEERWHNPSQIGGESSVAEKDALRKGWDLVLDIDCKLIDYSKVAAFYTVKVLQRYGIKSITCKFSGNKGFHIAVPYEAFPKTIGGQPTEKLFPEAPRRIAAYIKYLIKDPVSDAIMKLEKNKFSNIVKKTGMKSAAIIRTEKNEYGDLVEKLNAEPFLDIDTILISSRHLFRMPYSFHEKSELVSIPIPLDGILSFTKDQAKPENVKVTADFMKREDIEPNEASNLVVQAFDFEIKTSEDDKPKREVKYEDVKDAIPEKYFPPCIKNILNGLEDGRKRAVFILSNFFINVGWSYDQTLARLEEWNKKNHEPLKEVYFKGQLKYAYQRKEKILPPNCDNHAYYVGLQVCKPDSLCRRIKNPVQYAKIASKKGFSDEKKNSKKTKKAK